MQFPQQVVQQLIIYDENGNPVVIIGPGPSLKVVNPDDESEYWIVEPTPVGDPGAGIPRMRLSNGDPPDVFLLQLLPSNGGIMDLKSGDGTGELHSVIRTTTTSAMIRLGDADSVELDGDFVNGDYLELFSGGLGTTTFELQTFLASVAGGILDLQPDGGSVEYNGVPIMREVGRLKNLTNTATFTTTETVTDSITAPLVNGRKYEIESTFRYTQATAAIQTIWRHREDNLTGTNIDNDNHHSVNSTGVKVQLRSEYTATATGNKTFVITGQGGAGSGNVTRLGSSTQPAITTVREIA